MKDSMLWEGLYTGAGEECEEERAAEIKHYELTLTLIPSPFYQWRRSRFEGEDKLGEEGTGGENVFFRFVLISHYPIMFNW